MRLLLAARQSCSLLAAAPRLLAAAARWARGWPAAPPPWAPLTGRVVDWEVLLPCVLLACSRLLLAGRAAGRLLPLPGRPSLVEW
jgi:hypothetical protein